MTKYVSRLLLLFLHEAVLAFIPYKSTDYVNALKKVTDIMVQDAVSPVAASRYYAYTCIAANEVANRQNSALSLQKRITGLHLELNNMLSPSDPALECVYAVLLMGSELLPSGYKLNVALADFDKSAARKGYRKEVVANAKKNASSICQQILKWASDDNFKKVSGLTRYTPLEGKAFWKPTAPVFMQAVEPHWSRIRPLIIDSASQFSAFDFVPYDSAPQSAFYLQANDVYSISKKLTPEQVIIANFWDCNPFAVQQVGHVEYAVKKISPGGHWIGITGIACLKQQWPITKTAWAHVLVAATLMDAFISCWHIKYATNRVRPETVIHELIDPNWKPLLQTPPFPEFTSGHSVISNAAAEVLSALFGDEFTYRDTVEVEFGLPARQFISFRSAAKEAAVSRFYGGIHFMDAIDQGSRQGKNIGAYIIDKLGLSSPQ